MQHLAIMRKSWGMTEKIFKGQKTIESRWYKNKYTPWGKIRTGEIIYFKDSGGPVLLKARNAKVTQIKDLTPSKIDKLLTIYREALGLSEENTETFYELTKDKRYGLLIYLTDIEPVAPFDIDKKGFGAMSSGVSSQSIEE